ncbi:MAG: hypothetical protein QW390_02045, partial [Candidatus Bathyarchaeia archaeon]
MKRKRERFNPVQLLEDMVKVYSPSGEEGALSRLLFRQMRSLGFDVSHDQVGNVIGSIGHGPPEV